MGYLEYTSARTLVSTLGSFVFTLAFLSALALLLTSAIYLKRQEEKFYGYTNWLLNLTAFLLLLGFFVLAWFRLQIYSSIELINPFTGESLGRFLVPLWIEREKLYFWSLLLGFFIFYLSRKCEEKIFVAASKIALSIFVIVSYLFSNPFTAPLAHFHEEMLGWYFALYSKNPDMILASLEHMYARMAYFYNTAYMWLHPPLLFLAYASLVVTFLACAFMLRSEKRTYDEIAYTYAKFGYVFLTLGVLLGYPWAVEAWQGAAWWWDPKISGSLTMWLLYTAFLHAHLHIGRRYMRKAAALLGIICFLALILTYLLTYLASGVHAYG